MIRKPDRGYSEIRLPLSDGVAKIYNTIAEGEPGDMPIEKLELKQSLRFQELKMGLTRHFTALQTIGEVSRVIRCRRLSDVNNHDIAEIQDVKDGAIKRYEIVLIQYPQGVFPKAMDLTLKKIDWDGEDV